jgi:hypothetical protein
MRRNQREEKLKEIRRLEKESQRLYMLAHHNRYMAKRSNVELPELDYIELDEPIHAGWDVWIDISEAGRRRKDATILIELLDTVTTSKPYFTRNVKIIQAIRRHDYDYMTVRNSFIWGKHRWLYNNWDYRSYLEEARYMKLSERCKGYFYKDTMFHPWTGRRIVYRLDLHKFPLYELEFKVKKIMWSKLTIPPKEEISAYRKLENRMEWFKNGNGYEKAMGDNKWSHRSYEKRFYGHSKSRSFNRAYTRALTNEFKNGIVWEEDPEEEVFYDISDDVVCDIEKRVRRREQGDY